MDDQAVAKKLIALCQLDIDAAHAYMQAIERIDIPEVRDKLALFLLVVEQEEIGRASCRERV